MNQPIGVTRTNTTPNSLHEIKVKTRYTKAIDTTGWLRVRLEPSGADAYLCEYVKVAIASEGERIHFVILEGEYKGKKASLSAVNAPKCILATRRGAGAKIVAKTIGRKMMVSKPRNDPAPRNQLTATLEFAGKRALITLDSDIEFVESNKASPFHGQKLQSKPLPKGTYRIMAPQYPKHPKYTGFYVTNEGGNPDLKYHTVWFPIEYAKTYNSNFVHVGNLSEGCVTMYDLTMWNTLYEYLISNRADNEGKYVGTVTIE